VTVQMTSSMPGTTEEGYERLAAALLPALTTADGFIAHAAGPVEGGYEVSELWASEEAHTAWFTTHVLAKMPADAPRPDITFRPITRIASRADD
jgi:heme-degrading monooxygenase HmoA